MSDAWNVDSLHSRLRIEPAAMSLPEKNLRRTKTRGEKTMMYGHNGQHVMCCSSHQYYCDDNTDSY